MEAVNDRTGVYCRNVVYAKRSRRLRKKIMKILEISQCFPVGAMQAFERHCMNSTLSKARQQDSSELSGRIRDDSRRVLSKQVSRPCNRASKSAYSWLSRRITVTRKAATTFIKGRSWMLNHRGQRAGHAYTGKASELGISVLFLVNNP